MRRRTPQEKKKLSYERDRRNVYGEAPHAARKSIPRRKAERNSSNRHFQNAQLSYIGPTPDEDVLDELESRIHHRAPCEWEKYPDAPLGKVISRKLEDREEMRTKGGRQALLQIRRPKQED
jgi:hypothetical protein